MAQHDDPRRFHAAACHAQQQAQPQLGNPPLVENLDAEVRGGGDCGGALGEDTGRQKVSGFVGERPGHVARLAQDSAALGSPAGLRYQETYSVPVRDSSSKKRSSNKG